MHGHMAGEWSRDSRSQLSEGTLAFSVGCRHIAEPGLLGWSGRGGGAGQSLPPAGLGQGSSALQPPRRRERGGDGLGGRPARRQRSEFHSCPSTHQHVALGKSLPRPSTKRGWTYCPPRLLGPTGLLSAAPSCLPATASFLSPAPLWARHCAGCRGHSPEQDSPPTPYPNPALVSAPLWQDEY